MRGSRSFGAGVAGALLALGWQGASLAESGVPAPAPAGSSSTSALAASVAVPVAPPTATGTSPVFPSSAAPAVAAPTMPAPSERAPVSTEQSAGHVLAAELDRVLEEAADDLDLDVRYLVSSAALVDESRLLAASKGGYAIAAQLSPEGESWLLRLCVVRPGEDVIFVSRVTVAEAELEVRAIRLLQRMVERPRAATQSATSEAAPPPPEREPRSSGRALLTAHGALVGGYLGFSLEHIAGAGDARLVYPLMTLGAGAGVGASLVIAEEWDINAAEAWYVWAAGTWSTVAGRLVAGSTEGATDARRYGYSLLGTAVGLTLGTVGLNSGDVSPGGALLTHSGAVFGAHFGGIGQMMVRGSTSIDPQLGVGIGLGSGLLVAGAIAPRVGSLSSSRVLFIDVSAILGGMAGAALASPILVGEELSADESRIWLGSIALGTVSGAVVGALLTSQESGPAMFSWVPYFDVVPPLHANKGAGTPIVGLSGAF
jgi:hypothetical protein